MKQVCLICWQQTCLFCGHFIKKYIEKVSMHKNVIKTLMSDFHICSFLLVNICCMPLFQFYKQWWRKFDKIDLILISKMLRDNWKPDSLKIWILRISLMKEFVCNQIESFHALILLKIKLLFMCFSRSWLCLLFRSTYIKECI